MITQFNIFEGYVNKFDFEIGKSYEYNELPKKVRNDIDLQFEDYAEYGPEDYKYLFKLLTPEETGEYLEGVFGEWDIGEAMEQPYIKKIIKSIKEKGLDYPAVGIEGNHRALAYYAMDKPLPFLEMVLKDDELLETIRFNVTDKEKRKIKKEFSPNSRGQKGTMENGFEISGNDVITSGTWDSKMTSYINDLRKIDNAAKKYNL